MTTSYSPGSWTGVVTDSVWALILLPVDDPRVPALWAASADGADELLDVLAGQGLRAMPGFVLVERSEDGIRYLVREPGRLQVDGASVPSTARGPWSEGTLDDEARQAVLSETASTGGGPELPTSGGVSPAARVAVQLRATEATTPPAAPDERGSSAPEPIQSLAPEPELDLAAQPEPEPPAETLAAAGPAHPPAHDPGPEPSASDSQSAAYYELLVSSTSDMSTLRARLAEEMATEPTVSDEVDAVQPTRPTDGTGSATEELGRTAMWSDDDSPPASGPTSGKHAGDPSDPEPSAPTGGGIDGVIDGVPWDRDSADHPAPPAGPASASSSPPFPFAAPPAPVWAADLPENPPDLTQVTTSRAALLRQLAEERPSGPRVLAVRCPRGHLSPPYAPACRICGTHLPDQEPVEVPRPALGRLVLSNGSSVLLDRGVVFGRAPQSEVEDPAHRPHLIRLAESGEISRMQASVMLDGWQVMLRDLGSRNGTLLTAPGSDPEQIRPQQDYPLEPGSTVSLAEVVTFTYEVDA